MKKSDKTVSREEFDKVCNAVWTELQYQDNLNRRTDDEAKDVAGFLTLGDRYVRLAQDQWADNAGNELALHGIRKLAAIFVRAMCYCGIKERK